MELAPLNGVLCAGPALVPGAGIERTQLERLQLQKINHLRTELEATNAFYSPRLGGSPRRYATMADFREAVSFTTKHEVMRDRLANPPYGTNLTYPLERYVRCHQTSGTTNEPIRWLDTAESWQGLVDNWRQILQAAGVVSADRFLFGFSFGPFLGFWSALDAVSRLGCFYFAAGGMSTAARLRAILDNRITVLCCTPTYAQHLGEVAREKGMDLSGSRLRLAIVAGESGGSIPAVRARIEHLLPGTCVFDHHGMTEVGPVSFQCPARPGVLHVLETAYYPEVIEPKSGRALDPGETGELVLTTLDRVGSPLLRYRTGDLVQPVAAPGCDCGSTFLALQGGILGRSDDMVVVRGVNVYPALVDEVVRRFPEVFEYRVKLDTRAALAEIALEVEPIPDCRAPAALGSSLQESFQDALNLRMPVTILPPMSLPRFEMKAQRWVRAGQ